MPIQNEQLEALPVILSTYEGLVKADAIIQSLGYVFNLASELVQSQHYPRVFHIIDTRQADTSFGDMISVLKMGQSGTFAEQRGNVQLIFVGTHSMMKFFVNAVSKEQFGGVQPPLFRQMEDAMDYIQTEMRTWPQP